eukprot:CAMPEP_0119571340 /NCGR_PEP_ID=MMETSP1352-20130426/44071_1 /TAXON_ID=265584 /ORGANISM="Stauroneis constricta, Strain CCMP1120" /LENGTH=1278 /DNA_ID=CAMNT_0007621019 /DNA_START=47 /DNA_END=3883 /DNA_ORIENTATION=-
MDSGTFLPPLPSSESNIELTVPGDDDETSTASSSHGSAPRGDDLSRVDDDDNNSSAANSHDAASISSGMNMSARSSKNGDDSGAGSSTMLPSIAKHETLALMGAKCIVLAVLVTMTAALATGIYFYVSNQETNQFEDHFEEYSNKILEGIGGTLEETFGAIDLMGASIVASTPDDQAWPTVKVPNFALRASKTIALSRIKVLVMCVVVTDTTRPRWENFTAEVGREWVDETLEFLATDANFYGPINTDYYPRNEVFGQNGETRPESTELMIPAWYAYPIVAKWSPFNYDYFALDYTEAHRYAIDNKVVTITEPYMLPDPDNEEEVEQAQSYADWYKDRIAPDEIPLEPAAEIYFPMFGKADEIQATTSEKEDAVALFAASFYWRDMIRNLLPSGTRGIIVVTENPCAPSFTYKVSGPDVTYIGRGDHHDSKFNHMAIHGIVAQLESFRIHNSTYTGPHMAEEYCPYSFSIYPTNELEDEHITKDAILATVLTISIFLVTALTFLLYDFFVERRQKVVLSTAEKSNAVVSSLFPANVRDRLYAENAPTQVGNHGKKQASAATSSSMLNDEIIVNALQQGSSGDHARSFEGRPIAELYTNTTVMFADIVGFTAWSSTREPEQVFILLESIYGAFDKIARQRGVFKVETIGDSYVAVCGLPTERKHHAIVMVRFAADCRAKMTQLTRALCTTLGPSTADLSMRFGLNSGPTTAGVLRGDKSRFQLFGDTVNTAARMESNGKPNRIQVSQKTADLIIEGGKSAWVTPREDIVSAKGKGRIRTFWVEPGTASSTGTGTPHFTATGSVTGMDDAMSIGGAGGKDGETSSRGNGSGRQRKRSSKHMKLQPKMKRLVDWNVDLLSLLLQDLMASNVEAAASSAKEHASFFSSHHTRKVGSIFSSSNHHDNTNNSDASNDMQMPREEVVDTFDMPLKAASLSQASSSSNVKIPPEVKDQLKKFVANLAFLHQSNPFHNFDHATHVAMSTRKLLSRILSPLSPEALSRHSTTAMKQNGSSSMSSSSPSSINSSTYAVTSDPLIQFALVFSALIHDADHPGVSNSTLIKEETRLASIYNNKSVAEQNSVTVAWDLFMSSDYDDLRKCMFQSSDHQLQRFRQVVVNAVMATDIFDPELKSSRESRWEKAFASSASDDAVEHEQASNLRATIVIEHLIQASDVAHTMQYWTIYEKWNHRLFKEMRAAYLAGRTKSNPADKWYEGELWFYDNYVIPLASKLKECGVFGVSCDEALDYARDNRLEWQQKGRDVVQRWLVDEEQEKSEGSNSNR